MPAFLLRTSLLSLLLSTPAAVAVEHAPAHGDHAGAGGLHLNQGQRWATNAALRQGMGRIRDAATAHADAGRPMTAAEATRLAEAIRKQADYLVTHCVLAPEADAVLHVLLGRLLEGAGALQHNPADAAALQRIHAALQDYPVYFDHEGWRPATAAAPVP